MLGMWWNSKWNYSFKWYLAVDYQCNWPHGNPANFFWLDGKSKKSKKDFSNLSSLLKIKKRHNEHHMIKTHSII